MGSSQHYETYSLYAVSTDESDRYGVQVGSL